MSNQNSAQPELASASDSQSELRNVVAMTLPVVITTTSRAIMDVADYVMISGLRSDNAQAAILPAQMIMFTCIVLGMGTVSVVSTFAAQSLGRNRSRDCGAYAWQVLYLAIIFGFFSLFLRSSLPELIALFRHDPEVQRLELAYANIILLTIGPTIAANGLAWYFIGIHKPYVAMWSALEANLVNVIVSLVLIYGCDPIGIAPMGLAGAAWGTLVGVVYRMMILIAALLTKPMEEQFGSRSGWKPSWPKIKALLRVGLPCGLQWLSEVLVWALFVIWLVGTKFGTAHQVATNTAWQFMRLAFMPTIGVGHALTSLVGRSIGAGMPDRAIRQTRIALTFTLTFLGTLSIIYFCFGRQLIGLFNDSEEIIRIGGTVMACAAVFQLFDALGITYNSALRGAGDTFWPSIFFVVSNWTVIIGGGTLIVRFKPEWGSVGPWMAASTLIIITALFLWTRWQLGGWKKINLFKDEPTPVPEKVAAE